MPLRKSLKAFMDRFGQVTAGANQLVSTGHYQATIDFSNRTLLDELAKLIELAIEPSPIDLGSSPTDQ